MAPIEWSRLSDEDLELVRSVLVAAHRGPFFEEWEFGTLMGVTRAEMGDVIDAVSVTPARWPDAAPEFFGLAANNALVNLWSYPLSEREVAALAADWGVERAHIGEFLDRQRTPRR
ncbi:hypothetical protein ACE2AJ_04845 [Aquihabitans daechungensis]|uniref:hypothetical protein n=1 Tax=Aquihabitans daechungensis TaxID=1052257 RepID=UPI003B9FB462